MIDGKFEYFAFISYKEEDAEWAKWLQRKLEHYKLPTALRKENPELPERVSPIYEYKSEAGGGRLKEVIWKGLTNSKYLIVICSPRATQSNWLNDGIHYFVDSGKEECIIPFIIDGKPKAENVDEECFPSALRDLKDERELRGININEMGRDAAVVKVVSQMFNVKFDTLWQRYEREKRRKRFVILATLLLFSLGCLAIGGYIVSQNVRLDEANKGIIQERDRANVERDKAENANASLRIANDSIRKQEERVLKINEELTKTNNLLTIERDNVIIANRKMMENRLRFIAEKASTLVGEGDSYTARIVLLDVIRLCESYNLYIPEVEAAMRKAYNSETAIIRGHEGNVFKAIFSPDECLIASCSADNEIKLWDSSTGELLQTLKGHTAKVHSISFSPDGQLMASSSEDGTIRIWNVKTYSLLRTFADSGWVNTIDFSPDGENILSASFDSIKIWNVKSGNIVLTHEGVTPAIYSIDGRFVASACNNRAIKVWDSKTGCDIVTLEGHDNFINSLVFSPDGKQLCSAASDIKLWDLTSGECVKTITGHESTVESVSYRDDGFTIVSSSRDATIRIWNVKSGEEIWKKQFSADYVWYAQYDKNAKRILAALSDGTFIICDLTEELDYLKAWKNNFTLDIELEKFNYVTSIYPNKNGNMMALVISNPDTNINEIKLLDLTKDSVVYSFNETQKNGSFSPCGNYFAFGTDKGLKIWNKITKKVSIIDESRLFLSAVFKDNGSLIAASSNEIKVWDFHNGICGCRSRILSDNNVFITFNENGTKMAVKNDIGKIKIVEVLNNKDLCIIDDLYDNSNLFKFGSDDKTILTLSVKENIVKVFDLKTGKLINEILGENSQIYDASYCENGKQIVLISSDGVLSVYDSLSGKKIMERKEYGYNSTVSCMNGKNILCSGFNSYARIYEYLDFHKIISQTRQRFMNRELTSEERKKYYLE